MHQKLPNYFDHVIRVMVPKLQWLTQSFFSVSRKFFSKILQPTHFISKISFFWVKVFPDLKSVGWLQLTVEYLKLSSNTRSFDSRDFFDPISHLRDFSPPTPFLKYLIKNHRLVKFSQFIAQNDQWNRRRKMNKKFPVWCQI